MWVVLLQSKLWHSLVATKKTAIDPTAGCELNLGCIFCSKVNTAWCKCEVQFKIPTHSSMGNSQEQLIQKRVDKNKNNQGERKVLWRSNGSWISSCGQFGVVCYIFIFFIDAERIIWQQNANSRVEALQKWKVSKKQQHKRYTQNITHSDKKTPTIVSSSFIMLGWFFCAHLATV